MLKSNYNSKHTKSAPINIPKSTSQTKPTFFIPSSPDINMTELYRLQKIANKNTKINPSPVLIGLSLGFDDSFTLH